jgi:hypothetical protein
VAVAKVVPLLREKANETLFRGHALTYQKGQNRTKGDKSSTGSFCLGIGIVGMVVLLIFPGAAALFPVLGWAGYFAGRMFLESAPLIVGAVYVVELFIFGALIVIGANLLLSAFTSPLKKVSVPGALRQ